MMTNNVKREKQVIDIVQFKKPSSVEELVEMMVSDINLTKDESIKILLDMEDEEMIRFVDYNKEIPQEMFEYVTSSRGIWYVVTVALAVVSSLSVIFINDYDFIYIRYILGTILVMFLPGFSLSRILYLGNNISVIKIALLSVGISIIIASITGLILNYTPWGINTTPLVFVEAIVTLVFSTIALFREHTHMISIG